MPLLEWKKITDHTEEAWIGTKDDGVRFSLDHRPTCHRRGVFRLLIEVAGGPNHEKWGCFDEADQPMRNYHLKQNALSEAEAIAEVLLKDRFPHGVGKIETNKAEWGDDLKKFKEKHAT